MGFKTNPPTHEILDLSTFGPVPPPPTSNVPDLGGSSLDYYSSLDYWLGYTGGGSYVDPVVPRSQLNNSSKSNAKQQATIAGAGSVIPLLFGRRRVGGRIAGIQIYDGKLYLLIVWCWGTILGVDAIESVEVANHVVTDDVHNYLGNQTEASSVIVTAKRNTEHLVYADVLPGVCYSVIGVSGGKSSGFPTVNATIRGMKIASTDGGTKAYSNVPAYIIADFITNADYGMGAKVNWTDVATLAARNNSVISGSEVRNQLDVLIDVPQTKSGWLSVLCDYAGCFPFKEGDTWRLVLDAPTAPSPIISLGPSDLVAGSLKLTKKDIANSPTVMQITYTDTSKTPWADAQAVAYAPGVLEGTVNRRVTQIAKPGITRHSEAYRYAVQRENEALLADLTCSFKMFDAGIKMAIGDVFALTHPIGLTAKLFRCLGLSPDEPGRWTVSGSEYDAAKYSNDVVSAPSTLDSLLPSPFDVPDVVGLNVAEDVYQIQTGRFASRLVITWDGPTVANYSSGGTDYIGYLLLDGYDILVTQGTNQKSYQVSRDTLKFVTEALPENLEYLVQIRAHSAVAQGTLASFIISTVGKTAVPSDVPSISGYSTNGETRLSWLSATDLDLTGYELRYGLTSATWETATLVAFVAAPTVSYMTTIIPQGLHRIFIKALDSVRSDAFPNGQPSVNAAYIDITVSPNAAMTYNTYEAANPTLTNMYALNGGGWVTDAGTVWDTLFPGPSVFDTFTNVVDSYSAGSSTLVSDTIDLGAATPNTATLLSNLAYSNLSGTAQPFIEWKLNSGDSWTRINAQTGAATCRYLRVGITTTGSVLVTSLGQLSVEFAP